MTNDKWMHNWLVASPTYACDFCLQKDLVKRPKLVSFSNTSDINLRILDPMEPKNMLGIHKSSVRQTKCASILALYIGLCVYDLSTPYMLIISSTSWAPTTLHSDSFWWNLFCYIFFGGEKKKKKTLGNFWYALWNVLFQQKIATLAKLRKHWFHYILELWFYSWISLYCNLFNSSQVGK